MGEIRRPLEEIMEYPETQPPPDLPASMSGLRLQALGVLDAVRQYMRERGRSKTVFIVTLPDGRCQLASDEVFSGMMDSGAAKDALFAFIRHYIDAHHCTGCIFVTEAWRTLKPFKRGESIAEMRKRSPLPRNDPAREEVLIATAQTATHVLTIWQTFAFEGYFNFGKLEEYVIPQEQFTGRQKMFGDLRKENLG